MNRDKFITGKKIRNYWARSWERIKAPLSYKYIGGYYIDKITKLNVTLEYIVHLMQIVSNVKNGVAGT